MTLTKVDVKAQVAAPGQSVDREYLEDVVRAAIEQAVKREGGVADIELVDIEVLVSTELARDGVVDVDVDPPQEAGECDCGCCATFCGDLGGKGQPAQGPPNIPFLSGLGSYLDFKGLNSEKAPDKPL